MTPPRHDEPAPSGTVALPDDLPVEERRVVRVVVIDAHDRVLLFQANDVAEPALGTWWELPGGGIEAGETPAETAIRELAEETGIVVTPAQLSAATWRRTATYRYRAGVRRVQHEVVMTARLPGTATVDTAGQLDYELEDYTGSRWWPVAEVRSSAERFYPGRLPELIDAHLRGETIDEPFELWS
jgi:8-oxo-dGTP pyrophosphatase MutT (NUDIX family)